MSFFLYHLFDDGLELVQSCPPLQSCHWLLEVSETALDATLLFFGKSGCLVVAKVPAPPAVVCFREYVLYVLVLHQSGRVLFLVRSQYGPHSFTFSSD